MAVIQKKIEGLTNDAKYFAKVFTVNPKGRVNNRVDLPFVNVITSLMVSYLPLGTIINVNEYGVPVPYVLLKHNYEADINGAGRDLLLRVEAAGQTVWDGSTNTWGDASIKTVLETHKLKYDSNIQEAINDTMVEITTASSKSACSVVNTPVFVFSQYEVFGSQASNTNKEGEYIEGAKQYIVEPSWSRTINRNTTLKAIAFTNGVGAASDVTNSFNYQPCIAPLNGIAKRQADGSYLLG